MTKIEFLAKHQQDAVRDHLENVFTQCIRDAVKEIKESDEYTALKEEYLTTKEYENFLDKLKGEDPAIGFADWFKRYKEEFFDGTNLINFIINFFSSDTIISESFGFPLYHDVYRRLWDDDLEITEDNYVEIVESIAVDCIDRYILLSQEEYADRTTGLKYSEAVTWLDYDHRTMFQALVATLKGGSLEDLENQVRNAFDYTELVIQ